jgi:hypothetical protein
MNSSSVSEATRGRSPVSPDRATKIELRRSVESALSLLVAVMNHVMGRAGQPWRLRRNCFPIQFHDRPVPGELLPARRSVGAAERDGAAGRRRSLQARTKVPSILIRRRPRVAVQAAPLRKLEALGNAGMDSAARLPTMPGADPRSGEGPPSPGVQGPATGPFSNSRFNPRNRFSKSS